MKKLSFPSRLYILASIIAGAALIVWHLGHLNGVGVWALLAVSALAALAQVLKVEGPTERSSYNISWVVYGFTFVLFGPSAALVVILVSHLVEWAWYKYAWYIQAFNIATFTICISLAGMIYGWLAGDRLPGDLVGLFAVLSALAAFTFLNHLLIGLVLKLARGQSFMESGVFSRLTLIIDFTLLGMGAGGALIWLFNPYATLLAVIPLYLIYHTLKIPALQRQTQTDSKTGLFNARYFSEALASEVARAERFNRPVTVVMADLDLLRNINNSYGHLAGDVVLVGVAQILAKSVREYDIVARFGGEEFAILMPETSPDQALPRIEAIRAAIELARFQISTSLAPIQATMSFGVAGRGRLGQLPNDIIHSADVAVYQAKLAGRNRVCFSTAEGEAVLNMPPSAAATQEAAVQPPPPSQPAPESLPTEAPPPTACPSSAVKLKSRPAWAINVYIIGVAAVAMSLLGVLLWPMPRFDWFGLGLFAILVMLTEFLAIDIYVRDTSISTTAAPLLAGALLFGPAGVLILCVAQSFAALIKHRSPLSRFVFNTSNQTIANLLCYAMIWVLRRSFAELPLWEQVLMTTLGASVVYISSTGMLAGAIDLSSGQPWRQVWAERFQWLWPFYLALGLVAYALAKGYLSNGLIGVAIILIPLLMLRFSQTQYIDHTKAIVDQLRTANAELLQRSEEVSALNEGLILALSRAIDLRDPYVQGHSINVARYATLIANELGLPPERIELVRKAGLLHDIGKLGISEAILFKPGHLTIEEYETIKQHAALGAEIVQDIRSLNVLATFIRHHHENYDGRGYPDGLHGLTIPLEARILSVADAVEAMASDRPYRLGMDVAMIMKELQTHTGTQFDPDVVAAFAHALHNRETTVIVNSAHHVHARSPEKPVEKPEEMMAQDNPRLHLSVAA